MNYKLKVLLKGKRKYVMEILLFIFEINRRIKIEI